MKNPEFVVIYSAYAEIDTTEGRAGTRLIGHFLNEDDASNAAEGHGVWGHRGPVKSQTYLSFDDGVTGYPIDPKSLTNLKAMTQAGTLRTQALNKLTPEERKTLGV